MKLEMRSTITAQPFYERHGYISKKEVVHTLRSGIKMRAILMEKVLI